MENISLMKKKVYANYLHRQGKSNEYISKLLDCSQSQAKSYVVSGYDIMYNFNIKYQQVIYRDGSTIKIEPDAMFVLPAKLYEQLIKNCKKNFRDLYEMNIDEVVSMIEEKCDILPSSRNELVYWLIHKGELEKIYLYHAHQLMDIAENGIPELEELSDYNAVQDKLQSIINPDFDEVLRMYSNQGVNNLLRDEDYLTTLTKMAIFYNLYYNGKMSVPRIVELFNSSIGWGNSYLRKIENENLNFEEWADYKFILSSHIQNLLLIPQGVMDIPYICSQNNYGIYKLLKPRTGLGTKAMATMIAYKDNPKMVQALYNLRQKSLINIRDHFHEKLIGKSDDEIKEIIKNQRI